MEKRLVKKSSPQKKATIFSADTATRWIGSRRSLIIHSIIFIIAFLLPVFGTRFDLVLLILTTAVSLEAIYLAIFIQMTVNKNSQDIGEIQEDVEEIQENVEEIQEDIEEIEEEQEKDDREDRKLAKREHEALSSIQGTLKKLSEEIEQLKK